MSQSAKIIDNNEQWRHVHDAKERKKIQNRNAQRAYRERSKRRVEALEQICQGSEHDALFQRKVRCVGTSPSSRPVGPTNEHTAKVPCSPRVLSPTCSNVFSTSLTPPFDETYTGFEAICDDLEEGSSTSPLDFSWVVDSSLNLCNFSSATTVPCANNSNTIPSDVGARVANGGVIPGESSPQPPPPVPFEGQTALHLAASSGGIAAVTTLIEMSADVLAKDDSGRTALHLAVETSQEAIVVELVKHKTLVDEVDKKGETALHLAVAAGNEPIVRLLLGAGSSVDMKDGNGRTALHVSAIYDNDLILKLLLAQGANIDAKIRA